VPDWLEEEEGPVKEHVISGDVILEDCTAVGANAVVMPRNHVPEGTVIGALTYVPPDFPFEPWSVYAGIPARRVGPRDRDRVRRQVDMIRARLARFAVERA
jgi:acetyltransferase-like isoleucine patch superfamily enzyme